MEEKKITEAQSLQIITEMIERSNVRRQLGNGDIMLMWGYLTVIVTALVWATLLATHNPVFNWLWFLIPVVGGVATPIMARKRRDAEGVKTYIDSVGSGLWTIVGCIAAASVVICLCFSFCGYSNCWHAMMVFALLIVGFAEAFQGLLLKMKAMTIGGSIGTLAGLFLLCVICAEITMYAYWVMPLFIVSFICMMIIPGHILNTKARQTR